MSELRTVHYKIMVKDEDNQPESPFSAVLLSDLHNCLLGENNEKLLHEIRRQEPEFVLSAGDLLTAGKENDGTGNAAALLRVLTDQYPVYAANGNHEERLYRKRHIYGDTYEKYTELIRSYGVQVLEDTSAGISVRRMRLMIWGYDIPAPFYMKGRHPDLSSDVIRQTLGTLPEGYFHILLAHHPGYFPAYADWGADLTCSGHYHGGLVRVPFFGGLISPQFRLFPRYCHGSYIENGKQLIVSSGLGWHTIPVRINNPPELVVLDFIPGRGPDSV